MFVYQTGNNQCADDISLCNCANLLLSHPYIKSSFSNGTTSNVNAVKTYDEIIFWPAHYCIGV